MLRPGGAASRATVKTLRTPSTTASVEAPPFLMTLRALERHQERRRLNACCRRWRSQGLDGRARGSAPWPQHQRTVRSVEARYRVDHERGPRGGDRRRAYGTDDPAFSRLMAVDPDRLGLDSAVYPDINRGPLLSR